MLALRCSNHAHSLLFVYLARAIVRIHRTSIPHACSTLLCVSHYAIVSLYTLTCNAGRRRQVIRRRNQARPRVRCPTAAAHAFSRFLTLRLRYGYAIVAGVRKAPLKVSKRMSATKVRFTARPLSACPIRSVVPAPLYCRSCAFISDPEAQQGQAFSEACQLRSRHAHTVGLPLPLPCAAVHQVTTV